MSRNRTSKDNVNRDSNQSVPQQKHYQQQRQHKQQKQQKQQQQQQYVISPSSSRPTSPSSQLSNSRPISPTSQLSNSRPISPSSSRPISPSPLGSPQLMINNNPFDDSISNPNYSPNDFYSNNTNARSSERRDSNQKKIAWDHQSEQQQRQQIQKYQQYQQYNNSSNSNNNNNNNKSKKNSVESDGNNKKKEKSNSNNNNNSSSSRNSNNNNNNNNKNSNNNNNDHNDDDPDMEYIVDEDDDDDNNVSDFFQNVYSPSSHDFKSRASVISMAESITTDRSPSTTSSQTLFQKDPLRFSNDSKNKLDHHDSVEMNVLNNNSSNSSNSSNNNNDKKNSKVSRSISKNSRPRPRAAEASVPLSNDEDDDNDSHVPDRPKSPTRSLLRMPSIMRSFNDSENPSNAPRRQKSLVRPERARNNHRRISRSARQMYDGSDEDSRYSVFSNGDDRRKSTMSLARRSSVKEPPRKRKWYKGQCPTCWVLFSRIVTFWAPPSLLSCFGMSDRSVQQAWREKMALVFIIFVLCIVVGFLTFGFQTTICRKAPLQGIQFGRNDMNSATIAGKVYDLTSFQHNVYPPFVNNSDLSSPENGFGRADLTFLFQSVNFGCKGVLTDPDVDVLNYFPCVPTRDDDIPNPNANPTNAGCHPDPSERVDALSQFKIIGEIYFDWSDLDNLDSKYVVYNGQVLDLNRFQWKLPNINLPDTLNKIIDDENGIFHGRDISHFLHSDSEKIKLAKCIEEVVKVGVIDAIPISCLITDIVTYVSFFVIVSVVLVRFFLAVLFGWILSWRLGSFREETSDDIAKRERDIEDWSNENNHFNARDSRQSSAASFKFLNKSRFSTLPPPGSAPFVERRRRDSRTSRMYSVQSGEKNFNNSSSSSLLRPMSTNSYTAAMVNGTGRTSRPSSIVNENVNQGRADSMSSTSSSQIPSFNLSNEARFDFPLMYTIMLVTCYSEGEQGIRTTLNSLARTDYPTSHKLIMIIADGIIFGEGNDLSTPDICLSLMSDLVVPADSVVAHSYVAIADGKKRHNMARVYAGYYKCKSREDGKTLRIPVVAIVKCGGPEEKDDKKPGNRGKRDSQMILMSFLQKVMFDERMTPLEYEFFNSIRAVTGVTPDYFEIVLMVDADTKIYSDSVTRMVACMSRDSSIMGLCGETKIANKSDSWVTMIQVFEYYISHHMQKAFESIFGGVTCLPGCFCMYRIKAPKGPNGYWVPILANPDIVEQYSENVVDTLHKKNLLLLGEDRYLSTLMLRSFPKRKMVFVPQAVCKTIVPDTFRVLRSQRRRWINSTVHNLLELVLIPDLCGTFCFSMQFVIFMELVGTVVLPAAISFTLYLVIISFVKKPVPYLPLALLGVVLGLPAILILLTTRKIVYVGWMCVYLLSLPIWNFVLPVYAYWHFDDFSWGQTRKVEGEEEGADHSRKEGEFDSTKIVMKRWAEWEREKQLKSRSSVQQQLSSAPMSSEEGFSNPFSHNLNRSSSEKTLSYTPSPLHPILRVGGKRNTGISNNVNKTRTHTTDSLMIPPPLSNPLSNYSSIESTNSSTTLTADTFVSTPTEVDYIQQQRSNNNYNLPEEVHLRNHRSYDS